jgi:hypothetical protein
MPWITFTGSIRRACTPASRAIGIVAPRHRPRQDVRSRNRILNREVDADPAYRRHRVRCIADRQQAGPMPARQPVERYAQQLDIVP